MVALQGTSLETGHTGEERRLLLSEVSGTELKQLLRVLARQGRRKLLSEDGEVVGTIIRIRVSSRTGKPRDVEVLLENGHVKVFSASQIAIVGHHLVLLRSEEKRRATELEEVTERVNRVLELLSTSYEDGVVEARKLLRELEERREEVRQKLYEVATRYDEVRAKLLLLQDLSQYPRLLEEVKRYRLEMEELSTKILVLDKLREILELHLSESPQTLHQ